MKKFLIFSIFSILLIFGSKASAAQATCPTGVTCVAAPTATVYEVNLSWVNACVTTITCTFNVERCIGTVAQCLTTSQVWQVMNTTPIIGLTYSDTAVNSGVTYSYFVVALSGGNTSGPSNEVAVIVPILPTAPTGVTAVGQ